MKTTAQLFDECLATVQNDVKMELDMSFALADKIDMILREKNISQNSWHKGWARPKQKFLGGLGGTHNFTLRTIAKISDALGVKLLTI